MFPEHSPFSPGQRELIKELTNGLSSVQKLWLAGYFAGAASPVPYVHDRNHPFAAPMIQRVLLNGVGTMKETWHYEVGLEDSGLVYQPGDSLAVIPRNPPGMVKDLLNAAKLTGLEEVIVGGESKLLADALREDLDLTRISRRLLARLLKLSGSKALKTLLAEDHRLLLQGYAQHRKIADAIRDFAPVGLSPDKLMALLEAQPPWCFPIASSPLAHPGEAHLTVATVRDGEHRRHGEEVVSTYLADQVKAGDKLPVYLQENPRFRLPASAEIPIIMVGCGAGIAPFRAFVEHRGAWNHPGRSWLIFGDQRYTYDFLYQLEWQAHLARGSLARLDVAFSRDQPGKVYVQHKLEERSREIYRWLQDGAHFYACGNAVITTGDVHAALLKIVQREGGGSREAAEGYVEGLCRTGRIQYLPQSFVHTLNQ